MDFCGAREWETEKAVLASAVARAKLSLCRGTWATVGCAMAGAEWPRALDVVADGTALPVPPSLYTRSFKSWKKLVFSSLQFCVSVESLPLNLVQLDNTRSTSRSSSIPFAYCGGVLLKFCKIVPKSIGFLLREL